MSHLNHFSAPKYVELTDKHSCITHERMDVVPGGVSGFLLSSGRNGGQDSTTVLIWMNFNNTHVPSGTHMGQNTYGHLLNHHKKSSGWGGGGGGGPQNDLFHRLWSPSLLMAVGCWRFQHKQRSEVEAATWRVMFSAVRHQQAEKRGRLVWFPV